MFTWSTRLNTINWKRIPGHPDYFAGDCGEIYSTKKSGRILKGKVDRLGYPMVCLRTDGVQKTPKVHRLIALTHLENPNGLPELNHKDGDKTNNSIDNLEWCTRSENLQHAWDTGLRCKKI